MGLCILKCLRTLFRVVSHPRRGKATFFMAALTAAGCVLIVVMNEQPANGRLPRTIVPMVSRGVDFRACRTSSNTEQVQSAICERPRIRAMMDRFSAWRGRPDRAVKRGGIDPIHSVALADLIGLPGDETRVRGVIQRLNSAARLDRSRVPALVDLSAAHLVAAGQRNTTFNLLSALDAAERAAILEPRNLAALFNRALALQALGTRSAARLAWQQYLEVDSVSSWADEARRWTSSIQSFQSLQPRLELDAADSALTRLASLSPAGARRFGWEELLSDWGRAVLDGDSQVAHARLNQAAMLGETLVRRGGDASLAEAVTIIHNHAGNRRELLRLAEAHHCYGKGRAALAAGDRARANVMYTRILELRGASPLLDTWTQITLRPPARRASTTISVAKEVLFRTDARRYPAILARTQLLLAQNANGALPHLEFARQMFQRAGELDNAAEVKVQAAQVERVAGNTAESYASLRAALQRLGSLPESSALLRAWRVLASTAAGDKLPAAALRIADEEVLTSTRLQPRDRVSALQNRAWLHYQLGLVRLAQADVSEAERLLPLLSPRFRDHYATSLRITSAATMTESVRARAVLDSIIAKLTVKPQDPVWEARARLKRADAHTETGNLEVARKDLRAGLEVLAAVQPSFAYGQAELGRMTLNHVVEKLVVDGHARLSLQDLEAGLSLLSSRRVGIATPRRIPSGTTVVRYAVTRDALLAWTLVDTTVRVTRIVLAKPSLESLVERAVIALEQRDDSTSTIALQQLYEFLIRPIERYFGPAGNSLVIVPDGIVARVPFAALRNAPSGQYLIQNRELLLSPTIDEGAFRRFWSDASPDSVVFISDPAFNMREFPTLDRLWGARREVAKASSEYAYARTLTGEKATVRGLLNILQRISVLHIASHAISDEGLPENAYLVLTPDHSHDGRLTAAEIARSNFSGINLVVLSACSSLQGSVDGGGFAGLTGAFLHSGVRGVVGGLWHVDDELTAELMAHFHRQYRTSGNAPAALRAAQLEMLLSTRSRYRSPSAWAGFEYAGNGGLDKTREMARRTRTHS